jgi:hypothetical protein
MTLTVVLILSDTLMHWQLIPLEEPERLLEFAGSLVNEEVTYVQPLKKVIVMAVFVTKTGYLWQLSLYSSY